MSETLTQRPRPRRAHVWWALVTLALAWAACGGPADIPDDPTEATPDDEAEADEATPDEGDAQAPPEAPRDDLASLTDPQPFWGHERPVTALVFSPRSERVYTVAPGEAVIDWEVRTGHPKRRLEGVAPFPVTGAAVDLAHTRVAVSDEAHVRVWDVESGALIDTIALPPSRRLGAAPPKITTLRPLLDGDLAIVGDDQGRVILLDIRDGHVAEVYETGLGPIVSATGAVEWLVVSGEQRTVALDRRRDPTPLPLLGELPLTSLRDLSAQGGRVIHGTDGNAILSWGPDFAQPARIQPGPREGITSLAVDARGEHAMVLTRDGHVELWRLDRGERLHRYDLAARHPRPVLATDLRGFFMGTADAQGVLLWPFDEGKARRLLPSAFSQQTARFIDGTHNVIASGADGRTIVYNIEDPQKLIRYPDAAPDAIAHAEVSRESNVYFASTEGGEILAYDLRRGKIVERMRSAFGAAPLLDADLDAGLLLVAPLVRAAGRHPREQLLLWDLASDQLLDTIELDANIVDLSLSRDASEAYVLTDVARLERWSFISGERRGVFDALNDEGRVLSVDPLGALIAVGGERGVSFYNSRMVELGSVTLDRVRDVRFTVDGRMAIIATARGGLYAVRFGLADAEQGLIVEPLVRMPSEILDLDVSDDGKLLVVAESRGALTFFDTQGTLPERLATLFLTQGDQWATFTPQGRYVASDKANQAIFFDFDGRARAFYHAEVGWREDPSTLDALLLNRSEIEALERAREEGADRGLINVRP